MEAMKVKADERVGGESLVPGECAVTLARLTVLPSPPTVAALETSYTMEEAARHATADDAWLVIEGSV